MISILYGVVLLPLACSLIGMSGQDGTVSAPENLPLQTDRRSYRLYIYVICLMHMYVDISYTHI